MKIKTMLLGAAVATLLVSQLPLAASPEDAGKGPGEPGERIWKHLERRLDQNDDGRITAEEWNARAAERFSRLDTDGDGVITESEVASLDIPRRPRMGGFLFRRADTDDNREVSATEWRAFLTVLDPNADGVVEGSELEGAFPRPEGMEDHPRFEHRRHAGPPRMLDRDEDGTLETADLEAIFAEIDANQDGALSTDELPRPRHRHHRFHHRHPGGEEGDVAEPGN